MNIDPRIHSQSHEPLRLGVEDMVFLCDQIRRRQLLPIRLRDAAIQAFYRYSFLLRRHKRSLRNSAFGIAEHTALMLAEGPAETSFVSGVMDYWELCSVFVNSAAPRTFMRRFRL
jgi:hypothetical protein